MGDKDILSKTIFKNLVRDFATYLFGLPVTEVELLDTAQQRFEERRADLVARVSAPDGVPFLLHIEIQNSNEPHMPVRMLRYLSDILLGFPGLPAQQFLVYIGKEPLAMADRLDMPRFSYRYDIVDMHRVDCRSLLDNDSPDAWVLAVLCDFKDCTPRETVHAILTRLVERLGSNPARLREYVSMLDILAGNRDLNLNIREELDMLAIDVEKLATYQMGLEKGIEKGLEKGIEKGMEAGLEKGAHDRALAIANNLLALGLSAEQAASATGLPPAEVESLKARPPQDG